MKKKNLSLKQVDSNLTIDKKNEIINDKNSLQNEGDKITEKKNENENIIDPKKELEKIKLSHMKKTNYLNY